MATTTKEKEAAEQATEQVQVAAPALPKWTVRVVPGDEYLGVVEARRNEACELARQLAEEHDCVVGIWKGASEAPPRRQDGTRIRPTVRIDKWFPNAAPEQQEVAAVTNGKKKR